MIKKWLKILDENIFKVEKVVSVLILVALVVIVLLQIFNRFVFKQPLTWSEEFARIIFTFLVFVGISLATKINAHFGLDFIYRKFKGKTKYIIDILVFLLIITFVITLFFTSFFLVKNSINQKSSSMQINIGLIYLIMPLFSLCTGIHVLSSYFNNDKEDA